MNKFRLLLALLFLSFSAYSQFPTPGIEGFENTAGPDLVTGPSPWTLGTGAPGNQWAVFSNNVGTGRWTINNTTVIPPIPPLVYEGLNSAYMNRVQAGGAGITTENYLATPLITVPPNGQLRFYTRTFTQGNQGTLYDIKIASGSSPANQSNPGAYITNLVTYTEDQLTLDPQSVQNAFNVYTQKIINFPANLIGTQIYIAFVRRNTQIGTSIDGDRWLIDAVQLNERCLDPTGLTTAGIFFGSANLTWGNPSGATSWEIEVLPAATLPTGFGVTYNGNLPYLATTTSYGSPLTQTPLTPNTPYKYYVRAKCPDNIPSEWVGPFNFSTTIAPPECGGNYVDGGGATANYPNNITAANGTTIICPATPGEQVTVAFTSFTTQATFDTLSIYDGSNAIPGALLGTFSGTAIPPTFTSSAVDGCLTFVFVSNATVTAAGWVANVTCSPPPACQRPTAVTAVVTPENPPNPAIPAITATSINVGWTNVGAATSFEYVILPCTSPAPTAATPGLPAPTNPFNITGLTPFTCYNVYIRGLCPGGLISDWSNPETATTLIAPPVCGGNYVDSGGPTGSYSANENSTVTICPTVPGEEVTVTFTSFNTEATLDGMYVYSGSVAGPPSILMASNNPAGNATGPLTLPGAYWGTTIPGPFTGAAANGGCLTFVFLSNGTQNNPGWLANVTCAPPPACAKPIGLTTSNLTFNSVQLNWTNVGAATSWQVLALPCASPAPDASTPGWVAATTIPFTLPLSPETCYNIYVRGDCSSSSNGVSLWAGPVNVTTPIAPPICGGQYVDLGGSAGNYLNNSNSTVTICPIIPGEQVTVTFTSFNTEATFDGLYVYDGNTTSPGALVPSNNGPGNGGLTLSGAYWGNLTGNLPGPFIASSTDGCLTFVFISNATVNNTGWVANITCAPPPTCPRPTGVTAGSITQNSASISWTEMGSATQWQVLVLPSSDPAPTAATPGWVTAPTNPFIYSPLPSGTQFKVYVRSFCNASDISLWSNPFIFATLITNDECTTAINVPVNTGVSCAQVVGGTIIGATPSTPPNTCGGSDDDDVWFSFVATATTHTISLNNITGSTTDLFHVLYTGSCTGLTQIYCSDPNQSQANGLIVGQTYYIRIYSNTAAPNQTSTFNVCIGTIPPPISTSTTLYTTTQLVEDVLFNSTCATISNITSSTGSNFGSTNGIGYFNQNGSAFPFSEGLILMSGDVTRAPGPNTEGLSDGAAAWPGDVQLFNYIQGLGIDPTLTSYNNATKLEFDFIPLIDNISFDFIFASEEYGVFQCTFSDAFAFFLTNNTTGITTNLAVLPSSTIPISVVTIRDQLFNNGCGSANPQYFGDFYDLPLGVDPAGAPHDFNGDTVALTASSAVIPGQQYHIILVVADRNDSILDSAVFLKGGSFNIGNVELGNNLLESTNTALCDSSSYTIVSGLSPTQYTFSWTFNGGPIPNETGPNLTVTQEGIYAIIATFINTTCTGTDSITIEFYDPVASGTPSTMSLCNSSGFGQFTLNQNNPSALGSLNAASYTVVYYASMADATAEVNALPNLYTNTTQFLQTIYVRVENILTGCFSIKPFNLVVQDLTPLFTITPAFSICAGTSGTITVTPTNYNNADAIYSWTLNGGPLPDTTNQITVTQNGTYVVTINHFGCLNTGQTVVTVVPVPVPDAPAPVTACGSYTLPALTVGNYFSSPNGVGPITNLTLTSSQLVYVYAQSGTTPNCTAQNSFQVTITPIVTPIFAPIGTICINDTAPLLPTLSNNPTPISGSWNPSTINTAVPGTLQYTFTPDIGICASPYTISITVAPYTVPTFAPIASICQGGTAPLLPGSSNNLNNPIAGNWSPATVDTATLGGTLYTFTPNAGQCASPISITINVNATPDVVAVSNVDRCDNYTLPPLLVGNYFSSPSGVGPITNLTITSTQTVYVYAQSGTTPNCTDQESFLVNITDTPQFTIEGGCNEQSTYILQVTNANFNTDTATYSWTGPNGAITNNSPVLAVINAGTYTCLVTVANGSNTCDHPVTFVANDISCDIPKGISPNNDDKNDSFDLRGFNVSKLSIFNRYGKAVYTKTEYKNEWSGQSDSGNELADGTYYYVMERKDGGDTKTGWVYINREVR